MVAKIDHSNRARATWLTCLASGYRTALACTIVGLTTLYGPASLQHLLAFPAFSYVTVILVVTDASLGDTLHGCWVALYATVQSIGPAILSLWLIGPAWFTRTTTALAAALAAFTVALPEGTHLLAKRIALGQIVITYVLGFIRGDLTQPVLHPLRVAASTGIGVLACVVALLLPYPRLACFEVKQNCMKLAENASQRLNIYVKAICAGDDRSAISSISQARSLSTRAGTKLLQDTKRYQESMKWERLPFRFLRPSSYTNPEEKLQDLEIPLRGMEMAVTSIRSFPVKMLDGELKEGLLSLEQEVCQTIGQVKRSLPCGSLTFPEPIEENSEKSLLKLETIPTTSQDLPSIFFLFCMKLLQNISLLPGNPVVKNEGPIDSCKQDGLTFKWARASWPIMNVDIRRLIPALKCSLSLGLAVIFGLLYSIPDAHWSGLPVAIGFASAREATFKLAHVRAQGTVLGTVYGVLGCFVFEKFLLIKLLSLLPWFVFTSFLRRSRMYGQPGGISAAIGAVLILGRTNFGPPSEFAIARIVETFIGLSCSIMVDLVFQPTRASSLAKVQLTKTFATLHDCLGSMSLQSSAQAPKLVEDQKRLKMQVNQLGKFIGEAEVEPSFWFLPFHGACYRKLLRSLKKMVDLLFFSAHSVGFLEQELQKIEAEDDHVRNKLDGDLEILKKMVRSSLKCLEDVTTIKSLTILGKKHAKKDMSCDLEMGKSPNLHRDVSNILDGHAMEEIMNSYLRSSKELVDKIMAGECEKEAVKSHQVVLSLSALGYCIRSFVTETRQIEEGIRGLLQWENPSGIINLEEISCKLQS